MKLVDLFLVFGCCTMSAVDGTSTNGSPVGLQNAEIIWTAPANGWPERLWTYKVFPQEFSEAVVSNLMALGSFTMKDRTNAFDYFDSTNEVVCFGNGGAKHLAICPSLGCIEYHDENAQARMTDPVVGVPDEKETTRLGLKYLRLVGIDISQLATKPGTSDLELHWNKGTRGFVDKPTGDEIDNYGVLFLRRIDGINVFGFGRGGGVTISFGNNAKVIDLRVCWRNLKHHELHDCPSPEQITKWIKNGDIALRTIGPGARGGPPPQGIRKLTITKATPLYDGKYYDKPMDFVLPYARFEAIAENSQGTTPLWFECSMTKAK